MLAAIAHHMKITLPIAWQRATGVARIRASREESGYSSEYGAAVKQILMRPLFEPPALKMKEMPVC